VESLSSYESLLKQKIVPPGNAESTDYGYKTTRKRSEGSKSNIYIKVP